jgi:hypothetical protein
VLWLVVTVPHTLARLVPAIQLTVARRRHLAGAAMRILALVSVVAVGAVVAVPVLGEAGEWLHHSHDRDEGLSRTSVIVVPGPALDRHR